MSRCPSCNAHNPEGADWCSQCYTRLNEPPAPAEPAPVEPAPAPTAPAAVPGQPAPVFTPRGDTGGATHAADETVGEAKRTDAGRFRRTAEGIDWECQICQQWNPIEVTRCTVCQTPFARSATVHEDDGLPKDVDEPTVLIASIVLPGAGHWLLGYTIEGAVRATLYVFTLIGGILLLLSAASAGASVVPAVPLLGGALLIVFATLFDVTLARDGRIKDQLLVGRRFFWFVIGLLGLLMLSFAASATRIQLAPPDGAGDTVVIPPGDGEPAPDTGTPGPDAPDTGAPATIDPASPAPGEVPSDS